MSVEDKARRKFEYNPCSGFECTFYETNAAVCERRNQWTLITLATQDTAYFVDQEDPDEIIIHYSNNNLGYEVYVLFQCARESGGTAHFECEFGNVL